MVHQHGLLASALLFKDVTTDLTVRVPNSSGSRRLHHGLRSWYGIHSLNQILSVFFWWRMPVLNSSNCIDGFFVCDILILLQACITLVVYIEVKEASGCPPPVTTSDMDISDFFSFYHASRGINWNSTAALCRHGEPQWCSSEPCVLSAVACILLHRTA